MERDFFARKKKSPCWTQSLVLAIFLLTLTRIVIKPFISSIIQFNALATNCLHNYQVIASISQPIATTIKYINNVLIIINIVISSIFGIYLANTSIIGHDIFARKKKGPCKRALDVTLKLSCPEGFLLNYLRFYASFQFQAILHC